MARHQKMRSDATNRVLEWCGTYLMPLGQSADDIESAGGDVAVFEQLRAAKIERWAPKPVVAEVVDGWEDCDDSGWDRLLVAMEKR